jgi:hypothetical protein
MTNKMQPPINYELLETRDFYAYHLSHKDRGILGGVFIDGNEVIFDHFTSGTITTYRGATLKDALAAMKAAAND